MTGRARSFFLSKTLAVVLGLGFSCLCGWGLLHLMLVFVILGAPGGIVYLALSQTNAEDGAAKLLLEALYLFVNWIFYFVVFLCIQKLIERRIAA